MNNPKVIKHIVNWLNSYSKNSKTKGFVIGISGGIDSAVTSTLCSKTGLKTICIEMPIFQSKEELERSKNHISWLKSNFNNVESLHIDLTNSFSEKLKNNKVIKDSIKLIDISEKSFKASSQLGLLKEKLKKNPNDLQINLDLSTALFGSGEISESYELLLSSIKNDPNWNDQAARKQLLELFSSAGFDAIETINARRKLASLLFS